MDNRKHVVAKPIHANKNPKLNNREIWARVCYYYPQYTLKEVSKLPARDLTLLLKIAEEIENSHFFTLTQIVAAPHTKNGKGVKQLSEYFRKKIKQT